MRGKFLCGCDPEIKRIYFTSVDIDGNTITRRVDQQGFEICPEHGARMYGWASPLVQGAQGNDRINWSSIGTPRTLRLTERKTEDKRHEIIEQAQLELSERKARSNGSVRVRNITRPADDNEFNQRGREFLEGMRRQGERW